MQTIKVPKWLHAYSIEGVYNLQQRYCQERVQYKHLCHLLIDTNFVLLSSMRWNWIISQQYLHCQDYASWQLNRRLYSILSLSWPFLLIALLLLHLLNNYALIHVYLVVWDMTLLVCMTTRVSHIEKDKAWEQITVWHLLLPVKNTKLHNTEEKSHYCRNITFGAVLS